MKYIGIITVVFELLTVAYLFADYRQGKMEKSSFLAVEALCCLVITGTVILTFLNR